MVSIPEKGKTEQKWVYKKRPNGNWEKTAKTVSRSQNVRYTQTETQTEPADAILYYNYLGEPVTASDFWWMYTASRELKKANIQMLELFMQELAEKPYASPDKPPWDSAENIANRTRWETKHRRKAR
jgi:hypothetical protein